MNNPSSSPILVCLHGWGGSKESFTELRAALKDDPIMLLTPDLPGFGAEPEPERPWTNDDYADWVTNWLRQNEKIIMNSEKLFLLGHSHGGRIALKLAARQSTNNFSLFTFHFSFLFLCAPAGIKRGQYIKRFIAMIIAKTGKALLSLPLLFTHVQPLARKLFYRLLRTHDYEVASVAMRQTMIRVTSENLRPILKTIRIPTDIFWGTDDRITPYSDALIMKKEIPHATLHTYPGIRHAVHRERAKEIADVIRARIAS